MPKPYSQDLRMRVIEAVEGGASRREAAELYGISPSVVVIWTQKLRIEGFKNAVALRPEIWKKLLDADVDTAAAMSGCCCLPTSRAEKKRWTTAIRSWRQHPTRLSVGLSH